MGRADVLVHTDWVQQLNDPGALAGINEGNPKQTRRHRLCGCHHGHDAHRHYRPGSDCALCECPRWSPWNPMPRLARRRGR